MESKIQSATISIIRQLYNDGNLNKGVLASVRHATALTSPQAQTLWPVMMAHLEPNMLSQDGQPTKAEVAVYTAIRFYAIQQQGTESLVYGPANPHADVKDQGMPLFRALARLRRNEETRVALDRRMQPLLATTNVASIINALTHLVSMLKANDQLQKIDYPRLAQDLYWFQQDYEHASQVRLQWGQQYYRPLTVTTEGKKN